MVYNFKSSKNIIKSDRTQQWACDVLDNYILFTIYIFDIMKYWLLCN